MVLNGNCTCTGTCAGNACDIICLLCSALFCCAVFKTWEVLDWRWHWRWRRKVAPPWLLCLPQRSGSSDDGSGDGGGGGGRQAGHPFLPATPRRHHSVFSRPVTTATTMTTRRGRRHTGTGTRKKLSLPVFVSFRFAARRPQ